MHRVGWLLIIDHGIGHCPWALGPTHRSPASHSVTFAVIFSFKIYLVKVSRIFTKYRRGLRKRRGVLTEKGKGNFFLIYKRIKGG